MPVITRALAGAAAMLVAFMPRPSAADSMKQRCVDESERGQSLREAHDLDAARVAFTACAKATCPEAVRDDCEARLREIERIAAAVALAHGESAPRVTVVSARSAPPTSLTTGVRDHSRTVLLTGISLTVFGGAALALGGVLGGVAKVTYDDALAGSCAGSARTCSAGGAREVRTAGAEATASTVAVIAGAAIAGAGVTLWASSRATLRALPARGGIAVGLGGTF